MLRPLAQHHTPRAICSVCTAASTIPTERTTTTTTTTRALTTIVVEPHRNRRIRTRAPQPRLLFPFRLLPTNDIISSAPTSVHHPISKRAWGSSSSLSLSPEVVETHSATTACCNDDLSIAAASARPNLERMKHQRVWNAEPSSDMTRPGSSSTSSSSSSSIWTQRVADLESSQLRQLLHTIQHQERKGSRLRKAQMGVLHADPTLDMELLTKNYTVGALASALRDREDALQHAAVLAASGRTEELKHMLSIYHPKYVLSRRGEGDKFALELGFLEESVNDETNGEEEEEEDTAATARAAVKGGGGGGLNAHALEVIRKALTRMPRTVTQAHSRRAGVVIALCSVQGVPSILLEKRSPQLRAHPDEVCLPGGMVCQDNDPNIVATCLREMKEEISGLPPDQNITVLGAFRCNWGEVHHLVGVAVTPVVCYLGELPESLEPNPTEVGQVFTIPLASLLQKELWVHSTATGLAPIFLGGPHVIWGLTGYILDRFQKDILLPNVQQTQRDNEKKQTETSDDAEPGSAGPGKQI